MRYQDRYTSTFLKYTLFCIFFVFSFVVWTPAFAVWVEPTQSPPGGNTLGPVYLSPNFSQDGYIDINTTDTFGLSTTGDDYGVIGTGGFVGILAQNTGVDPTSFGLFAQTLGDGFAAGFDGSILLNPQFSQLGTGLQGSIVYDDLNNSIYVCTLVGGCFLESDWDDLIFGAWSRSGNEISLNRSGYTVHGYENEDFFINGDKDVQIRIDADQLTSPGLQKFKINNGANDTVFEVNESGTATLNGGLVLGNTSSETPGMMRWTGTDFEGYVGGSWISLTSGTGGGQPPIVGGSDDDWKGIGTGTMYVGNLGDSLAIGTQTLLSSSAKVSVSNNSANGVGVWARTNGAGVPTAGYFESSGVGIEINAGSNSALIAESSGGFSGDFRGRPVTIGSPVTSAPAVINEEGDLYVEKDLEVDNQICLNDQCISSWSGQGSDCSLPQFSSFSANVADGGQGGYIGLKSVCAVDEHVCSTDEMMRSLRCGDGTAPVYNAGGAAWVLNGPPGFTAQANDCVGFTDDTIDALGTFWLFDSNGGAGYASRCDQPKAFACCK